MHSYADIVDRVYIGPIRSVIALDDQFPTIDRLLESETSPLEERTIDGERTATFAQVEVNPNEIGKARNLVAYCRERQWMVDIHDGSKVLAGDGDNGMLQHLHQTDLLVLDYKLSGETFGGDRAIQILRALSKNPHFNIVVVYTKDDVVGTFRDIALSLLKPAEFATDRGDEIAEIWQEWLDEDSNAANALQEQIDVDVYLYVRRPPTLLRWRDLERAFSSIKSFNTVVGNKIRSREGCTLSAQDFGWWLLSNLQSKMQAKLYEAGARSIALVPTATDGLNWLRTENLFLTVVSKEVEGSSIIDRLRDALCAWQPSPHRLIVSSLRAELEGRGGSIEEAALSDSSVQVGLLKQLLSTTGESRRARLSSILDRHWSEILRVMKATALPGAEEIVKLESSLSGNDPDKTISRYYEWYRPGDSEQQTGIALSVNAYVSTQPVEGHHLTTGQIFTFEDAFWVCLSPLCDLEPGQNQDKRWHAHLGDALAFKAVKLECLEKATAIKYATSNLCIFLKI